MIGPCPQSGLSVIGTCPHLLTEFAMADYQISATRVCYTTYVTDILVISTYIVIRIKTRLCLVYTHTFQL